MITWPIQKLLQQIAATNTLLEFDFIVRKKGPPIFYLVYLRYMFLYERVLILCKKQETTGDYNFKFEFELDGLKIEDDKSKQNRFS